MVGSGKVNQAEPSTSRQIKKIQMTKRARANHLFAISTVVLMLVNGGVIAQTQPQHVHDMSHGVMPFDVAKTVHTFKMTESGGVERMVVKDKSNADQVLLIQQHLGKRAALSAVTIQTRPCCTGQICRDSRNFSSAQRGSRFPTPSLRMARRLRLRRPMCIC